jgi:hypothetical protein
VAQGAQAHLDMTDGAARTAAGRIELHMMMTVLLAAAAAAAAGPTDSTCNLAGVWDININKPRDAPIWLTITQATGATDLSLAWAGHHASGKMTASHQMSFNHDVGMASASPLKSANGTTAPDCTLLTFAGAGGARWCRMPFCGPLPPAPPPAPPSPPAPPDPETQMPNYVVSGAAAAGAVYPNGQPANYFLNHTGSSGWVIHLSGGGWRFLKNTSNLHAAITPPPLLSDGLHVGADGHCYGKCDGILSDDATINPLFHSYNKVWVPISGTSFTGDNTADTPYPIRGKRIQEAVIADLQTKFGMSAASDVILTGGSSGGLAVYLTCDRVAALIAARNRTTRYTCLADAGYFLDHSDRLGQPSTSPSFEESFWAWNSSGGTNQDCIAHYTPLGTPERCIFAQYVFPFIKSSIFIMQNLYDS